MSKILVKKLTEEELKSLNFDNWGIWTCEVSKFNWEYSDKESCYLYDGQVTVETDEETVSFGAGDFVVFPKGLKCVWNVKQPVRKSYKFGE
ncbi:MAG: cupin domain-containing protein [bacterium]